MCVYVSVCTCSNTIPFVIHDTHNVLRVWLPVYFGTHTTLIPKLDPTTCPTSCMRKGTRGIDADSWFNLQAQ